MTTTQAQIDKFVDLAILKFAKGSDDGESPHRAMSDAAMALGLELAFRDGQLVYQWATDTYWEEPDEDISVLVNGQPITFYWADSFKIERV